MSVRLQEYYKSRTGFAERQQLHQLLMFKGHYLEAGTMAVQVKHAFIGRFQILQRIAHIQA
jgi:hypothetical protein